MVAALVHQADLVAVVEVKLVVPVVRQHKALVEQVYTVAPEDRDLDKQVATDKLLAVVVALALLAVLPT